MSETEALLRNVMEKLYPESGLRDRVSSILGTYGGAKWQPEAARVKLAILKLADGNPDQVRYYTVQACRDYRNVLAAAESPRQVANPYARKNDPDLYAELCEEDRKQYQEWVLGILWGKKDEEKLKDER